MNEDELIVSEAEDDDEAFIPYDIASYPADLTLQVINDMWISGDIMVPEFQRNYVWTIKQASLLIDSFLMGLPVPQTFFYVEEVENKYLIIDGLQRILSVVFYLEGYFGFESHGKRQTFKLTGLDPKSPFSGKSFKDLDDNYQRKLKGAVLRAINIRQIKPTKGQTSQFHIFERLNTGGTPLKAQEIRNCVFNGDFVKILRELNKIQSWRKIIGKDSPDKHQKDIELILRIFAFSENWDGYEKPMKEFLNVAMAENRDGNTKKVERFISNFKHTSDLIYKHLGEKPFHIRAPLNTAVLDSVFCTIMDNLGILKTDLKTSYDSLQKDQDFIDGTYYGTSDKSSIEGRFEAAERHLLKK